MSTPDDPCADDSDAPAMAPTTLQDLREEAHQVYYGIPWGRQSDPYRQGHLWGRLATLNRLWEGEWADGGEAEYQRLGRQAPTDDPYRLGLRDGIMEAIEAVRGLPEC